MYLEALSFEGTFLRAGNAEKIKWLKNESEIKKN